jgi:hypothetical protein
MRALFLAATLFVTSPIWTALAEAEPFDAGVVRIAVVTQLPFDVLVWYPTKAEDSSATTCRSVEGRFDTDERRKGSNTDTDNHHGPRRHSTSAQLAHVFKRAGY